MSSKRTPDPLIAELRREPLEARRAIVGLIPEAVREVLTSHQHCTSTRDVLAWQASAISRLVAMADKQQFMEVGSPRAACPLCGAGGQYGYSVPFGLEMHLEGSHRAEQCPVFAAALKLRLAECEDKGGSYERRDRQPTTASRPTKVST